MRLIETPTHNIVYISRVSSSAIIKACAQKWHQAELDAITVNLQPGYELEEFTYKGIVPQTEEPTKPTVALMREPIDRILSGLAANNTTVEELIEGLESGEGWVASHPFFAAQNLEGIDKVFKFPEEIEDFCKEVGLDSLPVVNESQNPKPELMPEEREFLENYYAPDIKFYNSL